MRKIFLLPVCLVCLISCEFEDPSRVETMAREITSLKQELEDCRKADPTAGEYLMHSVFFNWKEDISDEEKTTFETELQRLGQIEHVMNVEVGVPESTGDKRLRSDYDMVLYVTFKSKEELDAYQADPLHLEVKGKVGPMLAGAPFVYDFMVADN